MWPTEYNPFEYWAKSTDTWVDENALLSRGVGTYMSRGVETKQSPGVVAMALVVTSLAAASSATASGDRNELAEKRGDAPAPPSGGVKEPGGGRLAEGARNGADTGCGSSPGNWNEDGAGCVPPKPDLAPCALPSEPSVPTGAGGPRRSEGVEAVPLEEGRPKGNDVEAPAATMPPPELPNAMATATFERCPK
mmetsp:Transcript_100820/g.284361  ORF Transcript_100820/g.284361 Transcript_100820/m.284361 type:complete len:193 (-) Transcript_100820:59-637(-)